MLSYVTISVLRRDSTSTRTMSRFENGIQQVSLEGGLVDPSGVAKHTTARSDYLSVIARSVCQAIKLSRGTPSPKAQFSCFFLTPRLAFAPVHTIFFRRRDNQFAIAIRNGCSNLGLSTIIQQKVSRMMDVSTLVCGFGIVVTLLFAEVGFAGRHRRGIESHG